MTQPETEAKSVPEVLNDLWELVKAYAKQQTIDPLKGLKRFFAYGFGGALLLALGTVLLALAALRALQTETDTTFTGNLSWIPYLITLALTAIVIVITVSRVNKGRGAKR